MACDREKRRFSAMADCARQLDSENGSAQSHKLTPLANKKEKSRMNRVISPIIVALILSLNLQAQTATNADELTKLLKEFLAGASRNDAAMHDRFWAEDLIYTGSSGRRIGKSEIILGVRSAPAPKPGDPTTTYGAEDIRI